MQKAFTLIKNLRWKACQLSSLRTLTLIACVAVLCAHAPSTHAAPTGKPTVLTVGIPTGLPGYRPLQGGEMEILDARKRAITACVEESLHAKFRWVDYPTNRLLQKLERAQVDLTYPMGFNAIRASKFLQSSWTWQNPDVFVSVRSIDTSDLALTLGAKLGSPQETDYLSDGYSAVKTGTEYADLPRMLTTNAVDAVVVPKSVYQQMSSSWPEGVQMSPGKARGIGFYLNNKDPKGIFSALNAAIGKCRTQPAATTH